MNRENVMSGLILRLSDIVCRLYSSFVYFKIIHILVAIKVYQLQYGGLYTTESFL